MNPKPFWLLNHFTIPLFTKFPFTDGVRLGAWHAHLRPRSQLVDFWRKFLKRAPVSNEARRSCSAKYRIQTFRDQMRPGQGAKVTELYSPLTRRHPRSSGGD